MSSDVTTPRLRATFADLPFELSEHIVLLAAHVHFDTSKATLASLSRTSRAINTLVQPILRHTVIFDDDNAERFRSLIRAGHADSFSLTRRVLIPRLVTPVTLSSLAISARAFGNISAFAGPPRAAWLLLEAAPNITMLITTASTTSAALLAPRRAESMRFITHLRIQLALRDLVNFKGPRSVWPPALTHVIFETSAEPGDQRNPLTAGILKYHINNIIKRHLVIQRILVRLPRWAAATLGELRRYARQMPTSKLWYEIEAEDALLDQVTVFDESTWLLGDPLYVPVEF